MTKEEKLEQLCSSESFVAEVKTVKSIEELQDLLARNGAEYSTDEIVDAFNAISDSQSGELSEANLEAVSGGVNKLLLATGLIALFGGIPMALGFYNTYRDMQRGK